MIAFEALGVGLGTAAFVAYIARATDPRYTATQFALFTSLAAVPRTIVNASTGWLVEQTGWFNFFLSARCSRCRAWAAAARRAVERTSRAGYWLAVTPPST